MRPDITPDLKVGDLLQHYPELEQTLVGLSPEFRRLSNPVLRRTVAKIATLRQVAKVGGLEVGTLVGTLRAAAGLSPCDTGSLDGGGESSGPPSWWKDPVRTLDARPIIEGGGHPLPEVLKALEALAPGEVFCLVTPFVPEPLLDVVRGRGYLVWTSPRSPDGAFRSYFTHSAKAQGH
ncbi:MAG TPA: DUF1858 domain-containing protein [Myxococcota bacterium]|nr:DUF1858 domain-containing protein [Myxococcota bacterium]HQK51852.1 DUF1858 domain-containing protein [Myxococcota bacterium]